MEAYSGWGGAQKAFSEKAEGEWGEIRDRLKELLSEDEFASQRHTVLTAFYTPAPVIGAIYDALREAGIGQGDTPATILEPGCGTGNFMRLAPADLALDFHGVELDSISARIAQALCPEAHITAAGLEECRVSPASFDAAIGNVPYSGDIKIDGMRVARALRAAPDAVEYLFRIQRKQCSDECVMKIDLLEPARRTYYQNSWHAATPASLSELATEEGLERFRDHRRRFMEAAKLAVEPADADRVASLERLESRLEAVQPVKLVPGQIACQLGSSWVPASVIRDFALETFKIGYGDAARERGSHQTAAQARGLEVRYSEVSGRWSVTSASGGMAASVAKKWGVGSYNCFMILTAALNGGLIQIEKDNPDYNPASGKSKKKIPDPVATAAANAKRRELEEAFREWVWKDEGRAAMLADIYNRKLNRVAPRAYSGDYLSLPGMSPDIQLRKHQRDAVARIIQDGEGTLIAHTVGAGKTFTGITAMHELKRLGRARKPMIVVRTTSPSSGPPTTSSSTPTQSSLSSPTRRRKAPTRCAGSGGRPPRATGTR